MTPHDCTAAFHLGIHDSVKPLPILSQFRKFSGFLSDIYPLLIVLVFSR
jgi:hypothetical protein